MNPFTLGFWFGASVALVYVFVTFTVGMWAVNNIRTWVSGSTRVVWIGRLRINVSRSVSADVYRAVQWRVSWRRIGGTKRGFTFGVMRPEPYRPPVAFGRRPRCTVGELIMAIDRDGNTECPRRSSCVSNMHGGYDACYMHDDSDVSARFVRA